MSKFRIIREDKPPEVIRSVEEDSKEVSQGEYLIEEVSEVWQLVVVVVVDQIWVQDTGYQE